MKLIGELKTQVDQASTREEAKGLILSAGMELTEEEMDEVSGGISSAPSPTIAKNGRL